MSDEEDFFDRIRELAERQISGESLLPDKPKDLSSLTSGDYPEIEITSLADQKIRELSEIVKAIESRPAVQREYF